MKKILVLIYSLFIILILFLDSPLLNNVFDHILLNLVISIVILKDYKFNKDKKNNILSFVLSIILFLMLSYRGVLASDLYLTSSMKVVFFTIIPLIIISTLFINISFLINNKDKLRFNKTKEDKLLVNKIFKVIAIFAILIALSSFKYRDYNDSARLLNWFVNGMWKEWHTIFWQIYVNFCFIIYPCTIIIQLMNTFIYLIVIKKTLNAVNKYYGRKALIIYTVLSLIFMQPLLYLQVSFKDILFSISLLGVETYLIDFIKNDKVDKKTIIIYTIFAIIFSNVRHLMFIPFIFLSIFVIIYLKKDMIKRKMIGLSVIIVLLVTFFTNGLLPIFLKAEKNPYYVKYTIPIYQISSFIKDDYKFSDDDSKEIEKYLSFETINDKLEIYNADSVSRYWRIKNSVDNLEKYDLGPTFLKINFKLFVSHPIQYMKYLWRINSIQFEIADPQNGELLNHITSGRYDDTHIEDYMYLSKLHMLIYDLTDRLSKTPVLGDILFRGGFYLFMYIVYIVINILNKNKDKILLFIPILVISLMFIISIPSQETRYILPYIIVFPLLTIETFIKTKKTNRN
ncbi:MAG: hypothetical protein IJS56_03850 [Bacilli bacterium]|nr:hypothetical protein [Bacilli bacterium]